MLKRLQLTIALILISAFLLSISLFAAPENLFKKNWKPHKLRISALKKYSKLLKRMKVVEDKEDICGQIPYIKHGYWDHGYLPEQKKYYKHKNVPAGFWVYVYPYWYIYDIQETQW